MAQLSLSDHESIINPNPFLLFQTSENLDLPRCVMDDGLTAGYSVGLRRNTFFDNGRGFFHERGIIHVKITVLMEMLVCGVHYLIGKILEGKANNPPTSLIIITQHGAGSAGSLPGEFV